ncbi:aminotransferase class III-fold pyridoxal phosphate-dependent enzyme [Streptomyces sp. P9(2023)]|uniref:aminotransferase class III-fold pyridoxal phosphate-dependent enzyme n=1 Tax=Streptomyces sp. P9(2023) TaxID=3064394 RepID=UPI0028F40566|nr:aminotransferase class III-fold pyridoxal phosphate-dependent enzyme [Streptomyces sp. P9(2023)]MDT9686975.1 aminotransferase class III-fold pyridoxal phosphate-dependent enzyme [Streptomyces sp. P9(2023)]
MSESPNTGSSAEPAPAPVAEHQVPPHVLRAVPLAVVEGARVVWWAAYCLARWAMTRLVRRDDHSHEHTAALLRRCMLGLGPLYMKVGQVLGTQTGLLSPEATAEFRSFFSELPAMNERDLRRTLARGLPLPVEEAFRSFDWEPVAVGSVAQVHRAVLHDGGEVAVKVVKAGVRERLHVSAWTLGKLLATVHALVPPLRRYDLPAHFAELRPLLAGQGDMRREALRQQEVATNFRLHPFVRVPTTYDRLCGNDILVMEYVHGIRGQEPDLTGHPRPSLARRMQDAFYTMVFFHGLFHVDPHPGNVLFGPDGQIVMLDFGLVGHLTPDDRWNLGSFYYACMRGQWAVAVQRFVRTFVANPEELPAHRKPYEDELAAILRRHFEGRTSRWSTMAFFDEATRLGATCGARASTRFSLLALSLLTGEGFVSQTDPDIDLPRNARRFTDMCSPYLSEDLREKFERDIGRVTPRSMAARRGAARHLVAPTHLDRYVLPSAFPLVVARAEGARLHDLDGNTYIDLSSGYGPHMLGYAHPVVVRAVQDAVSRGAVNALANPAELRLAEAISQAFAPGSKVVFGNSGTEAVQMALRMARAYTGRQGVAKFEGHYHGFSDQGLVSSLFRHSGDAHHPRPVANSAGMHRMVVDDTLVLQYGESASLERISAHARSLACVILEPMPSALGTLDRAFLEQLRDVCARKGVLVVYDEVVTGFRVHYGGAQHLVDVRPDLTCLGKIIGGGLPCGAVAGRAGVVDIVRTSEDPFTDLEHRAFVGGTMSGNSVTAAAGAAVLGHLRAHPEIYADLDRRTDWLAGDMAAQAAALGIPFSVRALRSIFSITFDRTEPRLIRDRLAGPNFKANLALSYYMRKHGVYVPELHTMLLNAAHTDDDVQRVSEAFGLSLSEMADDGFFVA